MQDLTLGLSGKIAIVTGAAGGIGRSTVDLLTANGARVVAEDINPAVNEVAKALEIVTLVGDAVEEATAVRIVELASGTFWAARCAGQ